jgi:hypothetical protein
MKLVIIAAVCATALAGLPTLRLEDDDGICKVVKENGELHSSCPILVGKRNVLDEIDALKKDIDAIKKDNLATKTRLNSLEGHPALASVQPTEMPTHAPTQKKLNLKWDQTGSASVTMRNTRSDGATATGVPVKNGEKAVIKILTRGAGHWVQPVQIGISTGDWARMIGQDHTRVTYSLWNNGCRGSTCTALQAYSNHPMFTRGSASRIQKLINEPSQTWNNNHGPQTITLTIDMKSSPHTIQWGSDKFGFLNTKLVIPAEWNEVFPSVYAANDRTTYTLVSADFE